MKTTTDDAELTSGSVVSEDGTPIGFLRIGERACSGADSWQQRISPQPHSTGVGAGRRVHGLPA